MRIFIPIYKLNDFLKIVDKGSIIRQNCAQVDPRGISAWIFLFSAFIDL